MSDTLRKEFESFIKQAKPQRVRTMAQWACEEIYLPDGPFEGQRFKLDRQPHARIWFDECMNNHWVQKVITGPSQSGKSLIGFVIPVLYHLFERRDKVIAAVPDYEMVKDKWLQDLLPALERTRYKEFIPKTRIGGKTATIQFTNGSVLRWMTAGGSDKSRAGYTAPVICFTETDGFDSRAETSDEADKIEQIMARCRSYPLEKRHIYQECTVSVAEGYTWRNFENGTASRLMLPCPHCGEYVCLEREHFTGYHEADTDAQAGREAFFFCSACGEAWSEEERIKANHGVRLVHKGQEISTNGDITGPVPDTHTLGFRWSAVNNCLYDVSQTVGIDEFKAKNAVDVDNEERKMAQFVWAVPYVPADSEEVTLTMKGVHERTQHYGRGVCPENTRWVTVGIDVNKPVLHWTATAWYINDGVLNGHVIDYGKQGVKHRELGFDKGVQQAIAKLTSDTLGKGWSGCPEGFFNLAVIDSRWATKEVIEAIKSLQDSRIMPYMGQGSGHWQKKAYAHPEAHSKKQIWIGNNCYVKMHKAYKAKILHCDANYWKTWLVSRMTQEDPKGSRGRITLFETTDKVDRDTFAKHLTSEKEVLNFEPGKGYVKEWVALRSANHWLDSTYASCVAGNKIWNNVDISKLDRARRPSEDLAFFNQKAHGLGKKSLSLGGYNPFKK